MDWGTHVVLAAKILGICGLNKGGAIYSNLPAIDSKPPEYHRVYAHILENQPEILDASLEVFSTKAMAERDFDKLNQDFAARIAEFQGKMDEATTSDDRNHWRRRVYAYQRILEEAPAFSRLLDDAGTLLGDDDVTQVTQDKLSAGVSLITHIFFDTFNNPVQAFIPYSSLVSAQWDFWDQIDYLKFRQEFYNSENINAFRKTLSNDDIWNIKLKPAALIKAMIIRIGEQGRPAIPYEAIDWTIRKFLRYMDIDDYQRVDKELKFLVRLEHKIIDVITSRFQKEAETDDFS